MHARRSAPGRRRDFWHTDALREYDRADEAAYRFHRKLVAQGRDGRQAGWRLHFNRFNARWSGDYIAHHDGAAYPPRHVNSRRAVFHRGDAPHRSSWWNTLWRDDYRRSTWRIATNKGRPCHRWRSRSTRREHNEEAQRLRRILAQHSSCNHRHRLTKRWS